jgi:imidazole glycerol-phosphate synthase subunit HisH
VGPQWQESTDNMSSSLCAIVDYGVGNLGSIRNILNHIDQKCVVTSDQDTIRNADYLVLPGVGAFDAVARKFYDSGLLDVVTEKAIKHKTPLLGICVGMQMLFSKSAEGKEAGLGWVEGEIVKFDESRFSDPGLKVPHMAWTELHVHAEAKKGIFRDYDEECRFYFVHSYHAANVPEENILAEADYGYPFTAAVRNGNINGVQFHPEKSHKFGMRLFRNFLGKGA